MHWYICENKGTGQLCSNYEADECLCFRYTDTKKIVRFHYFLNSNFPASSHRLCLWSLVCVKPVRKPRRPIFSRRGSNVLRECIHVYLVQPVLSLPVVVTAFGVDDDVKDVDSTLTGVDDFIVDDPVVAFVVIELPGCCTALVMVDLVVDEGGRDMVVIGVVVGFVEEAVAECVVVTVGVEVVLNVVVEDRVVLYVVGVVVVDFVVRVVVGRGVVVVFVVVEGDMLVLVEVVVGFVGVDENVVVGIEVDEEESVVGVEVIKDVVEVVEVEVVV